MTNSDYLIKATVKKISEKFNKTFYEKIEEFTSAAQEVPEKFKKEFDLLKEEIIDEANKMREDNISSEANNNSPNISKGSRLLKYRNKIESIKSKLNDLNNLLDK